MSHGVRSEIFAAIKMSSAPCTPDNLGTLCGGGYPAILHHLTHGCAFPCDKSVRRVLIGLITVPDCGRPCIQNAMPSLAKSGRVFL